ncbi:smoothelin [Chanos chanos]|uniref:Smoothelin n=1 Tax=Chanos chanos TaxID=29144 RepID=A0A6J2UX60_CHACN|nr:smoothelin [Chanos chanos]
MDPGSTSEVSAATAKTGPITAQQLAGIEDEQVLNEMLDKTTDFEERKLIREAMRELMKRKREKRERERGSRQQDLRQQGVSVGGTTNPGQNRANGPSATRQTPQNTAQTKPSTPSPTAPANKVAGSPGQPPVGRVRVQRGISSGGPNTKDVKQMLLDWCRAKTEPYEGVNIQNFSSSWADGLAFCALVHRFFPEGFEYSTLDPYDRRANFEKAFKTAERLADCPPLLDVEDLMRMREPDWKCVYTYIQEFYRCLVEKGLVKTKKRPT